MDAIDNDLPCDLPAPRVVAERCMSRAWDDDINDDDRLLMEQAARVLEHLLARLAVVSEHYMEGVK